MTWLAIHLYPRLLHLSLDSDYWGLEKGCEEVYTGADLICRRPFICFALGFFELTVNPWLTSRQGDTTDGQDNKVLMISNVTPGSVLLPVFLISLPSHKKKHTLELRAPYRQPCLF